MIFPTALIYQVSTGVGVWGNNHPVMWGLDIVSFIWWVGVAHAGTLISALLFLTRQHWRTTDWPRGGGDDGFLRDDGRALSGASTSGARGSIGSCFRSRIQTASGRNSARR